MISFPAFNFNCMYCDCRLTDFTFLWKMWQPDMADRMCERLETENNFWYVE